MEEQEFDYCISTVEQAKDLIIKLSGNLQNAEKVLTRDEDNDKEYRQASIFIDESDIIECLHGLTYTNLSLIDGKECVHKIR